MNVALAHPLKADDLRSRLEDLRACGIHPYPWREPALDSGWPLFDGRPIQPAAAFTADDNAELFAMLCADFRVGPHDADLNERVGVHRRAMKLSA